MAGVFIHSDIPAIVQLLPLREKAASIRHGGLPYCQRHIFKPTCYAAKLSVISPRLSWAETVNNSWL